MPDVSLADVFYIASYPFTLAAIVVGVRISWTRLARSLLDASVIAVALGVGAWQVLLAPLLHGTPFKIDSADFKKTCRITHGSPSRTLLQPAPSSPRGLADNRAA